MRDDENDNQYRIEMKVPAALRVVFFAFAAFVIIVPTWELHRALWPVNAFSPFFLMLILGAYSIGFPMARAAIMGWAEAWTVRRERIHIVRRNLFGFRRHSFGLADVADFEITENESMEGDNTWFVTLVSSTGEKFRTYDLESRNAAEKMRDRINRVFRG